VRLGLVLLATVAVGLGLLGPASARTHARSSYGGTLVIGLAGGDPGNLDPTLAATFSAAEINKAICLKLYDYEATSRIYPELAAALPTVSADKRTYTIDLRHGILFNDGTPFNAQAVVTTLERDINLPGSSRANDYGPVDSITASGQYTVVIHESSPFTPLLAALASNDGVVMSQTQLAKLGTNFGSDPVCVGPFMFDHRVAGDNVTVIKSPYFYDRLAVHLDKIVFKDESDPAAAVAALQAGDIQVLDSIAPTLLPSVLQNTSLRVTKGGGLGWVGIEVDLVNKSLPLASSPLLRKAFEEAIDKKTLVKVAEAGAATPACTAIPPVSPAYDPTVDCTPFDPADARAIVAESGFQNLTVHLLASPASAQLAQFVQAEEANVGINVMIDLTTTTAASSQYQLMFASFSGTADFDRNLYQYVATSGTKNASGYSNPRLDLILANARKADSPKALKTLYHAAEEILINDRPIIYLYYPITYAGISDAVSGVNFYSDRLVRADYAQYG
jgi:peptide/nickel transport system substrate-binding protein